MKKREGRNGLAFAAAAALLVAAAVTGCGGSGSGGENKTDASSQGASAKSGDGKILKVATNWEKNTFDPALWSDAGGVRAGISMFETLLKLDEERNIVPGLAESYEASEDGKTYTFHLRKGVQFHGGYGEFTSEDIAFTLERLNDPEVGATTSKSKCKLENIESMDTSDPYTFVLKLKEADNNIPMDFASWYTMIVSKKAYEENGPSGFGQKPVGTGPFEYESGKPAETYTIKRFEDYWGEKAVLDRVQITTLTDETNGVNAFNAGEVDLLTINDPNNIQKFKDVEGCQVIKVSDFQNYYLGFNVTKEPLNNPLVREAMKYAINYDEMLEDYWRGTMLPASGYVPSDCMYHYPGEESGFQAEYDPEKARELLAEAGYPDGFSITVSAANDSLSKGPLMIVQQYMNEIGIDVELKLSEYATYVEDARSGNIDMWFMVNGDGYRGDDWLQVFMTKNIPGSNWCSFSNEEYDALMEQGLASGDRQEKEECFRKAQEILIESIPSLPIAESCTHILIRDNVKNLTLDPNHLFVYREMDVE